MATGSGISIDDIVLAFQQLGGRAHTRDAQDRVARNVGAARLAHYAHERSWRQVIQRLIEDHCPDCANWMLKDRPHLFDKIDPDRRTGIYRLH